MSVLIAIDQGTTSTRTVAFDSNLNIVHSEQKEYSLKYPKDGWVEIEPNELMKSVTLLSNLYLMLVQIFQVLA